MKMNAGAWIGIIGGFIGFTVGIIAVLSNIRSSGIYTTAVILLVFGGMAYLFYKLFFQQIILANRLRKTGIDGTAVIKDLHDTGVTINNNPQIKLVLEVKNNIGQIYTTTIRTLVSRIQPDYYKPGMTVPVKIDPKNDKNVIINTQASLINSPAPNQRNATQQQIPAPVFNPQQIDSIKHDIEKLTQFQNELVKGKSAKAIIKNYQWLGANVNGNNPYVELTVAVLPDDAPSFEGIVKGVISQQAVNKYQPGSQIFVKYNPADKSKIIIDHS